MLPEARVMKQKLHYDGYTFLVLRIISASALNDPHYLDRPKVLSSRKLFQVFVNASGYFFNIPTLIREAAVVEDMDSYLPNVRGTDGFNEAIPYVWQKAL